MPHRITIEIDGKRVSTNRHMSEAEAREWIAKQAVRLTIRTPILSPGLRRSGAAQPAPVDPCKVPDGL